MYIIFSYIVAIVILKVILTKNKTTENIFLMLASLLMMLIVSLRNLSFGTDTLVYVEKFRQYNLIEFSQIINYLNSMDEKDKTFYLLVRTINYIGLEETFIVVLFSILFLISIFWLIYKYSNNSLISIILFICLGYLFFSLTGLRQTFALTFIIISYKYLLERKKYKFIILVLLASLFHSTALVFLIAYPLVYLKLGIKHLVVLIIAFLINILFNSQIYSLLDNIMLNEKYEYYLQNEESLNYSGFLIQLSIFLFCLIFKKMILTKSPENITYYNLMFIGLIFQLFATNIAVIFRISLYFSIFSIILLPNVISGIKDVNVKILVNTLVIVVLLMYLFISGYYEGYSFKW
ncbi:EpsG family protein [Mammaliicoccus sciuri]|uniref:EpsG family protein n=1 Tax=Mammaliicoccus sciuri TaxID=1296 RepID=UPI001432E06B|nr:EpsG family protein [Mammaliicoccus sciuri]NKD46799.1 EpsG family protein [Mammaliicoccus sciuri]